MKVLYTDEGLSVHYFTKEWAVVKTHGLLTGNMYQLYKNVDGNQWRRWPENGIELYKTIRHAREAIRDK